MVAQAARAGMAAATSPSPTADSCWVRDSKTRPLLHPLHHGLPPMSALLPLLRRKGSRLGMTRHRRHNALNSSSSALALSSLQPGPTAARQACHVKRSVNDRGRAVGRPTGRPTLPERDGEALSLLVYLRDQVPSNWPGADLDTPLAGPGAW